MKYYTAKDVMEITGLAKAASYELMANLNEKLKKEYPGTITLTAKVPKWYFDKKMKCNEYYEKEGE